MNRRSLSVCLASLLALSPLVSQEETDQEEVEPPKPPKPVATVDIKNSRQGGTPGGTTSKEGKWTVDAESKTLQIGVEPLVDGWLEFGPDFREKPGTIKGAGRAPGDARIQSRFGIGLYGPNGFQIRLIPAWNKVELVRRGEALKAIDFELDVETVYEMELAVLEEEEVWQLKARIWPTEGERPEEPTMKYQFPKSELLFPLAGRAVLTATPFSGEPVEFSSAEVFEGEYVPVPAESEDDSEEAGSEE